jgi:NAD(P)-dependent dehydrogenase (short-subunit alcohol dehydrogenase family)
LANSSGAPNRPAHNAPVLVIGLGRFGASTAEQLVKQGREVLAIERDRSLVQKWSPVLTHVVEADATNIDALRQLGAQEFSSAVVGVGTSIESSVLITVNLVDLGIEHLWVNALARQDTHPHRCQPRHLPRGRRRRPRGAPGLRAHAGLHRVRRRLRHREDVSAA